MSHDWFQAGGTHHAMRIGNRLELVYPPVPRIVAHLVECLVPWVDRQADEWSVRDLALELDMPAVTLFRWLRKGVLQARRVERGGHRQWLIRAAGAEIERRRALRSVPCPWARHVRVGSDDRSA
jgi:hypothetical protein